MHMGTLPANSKVQYAYYLVIQCAIWFTGTIKGVMGLDLE